MSQATQTKNTNQIGLECKEVGQIINRLNHLLSSYHIFYINVRGYHWNGKGAHFFTLHPKFEELYTALQLQIDEIAERILTLGGTPYHAYSDFAQHSSIQEDTNVHDGSTCVKGVVGGLKELIEEQRQVSAIAAAAEDQGSADLVDAYIQEQEKLVWMYNAFLGE